MDAKHRLIPRCMSHRRVCSTSLDDSLGIRTRRYQQFGSAVRVKIGRVVNAHHCLLHCHADVHRRPQLHQAARKSAEPLVRGMLVLHASNCGSETCAVVRPTARRGAFATFVRERFPDCLDLAAAPIAARSIEIIRSVAASSWVNRAMRPVFLGNARYVLNSSRLKRTCRPVNCSRFIACSCSALHCAKRWRSRPSPTHPPPLGACVFLITRTHAA